MCVFACVLRFVKRLGPDTSDPRSWTRDFVSRLVQSGVQARNCVSIAQGISRGSVQSRNCVVPKRPVLRMVGIRTYRADLA